jgi:hypothetical protein
VTLVSATATETQLLTTQYTITGIGNATGGTVTYPLSGGSPIPAGSSLTIQRVLPIIQGTSLSNQGPTFASIESALDYLTMLIQQVDELTALAITGNVTDPIGLNYEVPPVAQRALQLLGFDSEGNVIVAQPSSALVSTAMQPVVAAATTEEALSLLGGFPAVSSIAALGAITTAIIPDGLCYVLGYYQTGDGGGGVFYVGTTASPNGVITFNDASGRTWYRETGAQPYSVKWAGAYGNGSTDDTAAINACETATAAAGAAVFFPAGTYMISNASVTKLNTSWFGTGRGTSILKAAAQSFTNSVVSGGTLSGISIQNLGIDGANIVNSTALVALLAINSLSSGDITNCSFTNMAGFGIEISGGNDFEIRNNLITRAAPLTTENEGIILKNTTATISNATITGNTLINTGSDFNCNNSVISENNVSGWGYGSGITTELSGSCSNLTISGNVCTGGVGTDSNDVNPIGIENWAPYSTIIGNICFDNSGPGISQGGLACTVIGNIVYNNGNTGTHPGILCAYFSSSYNGSDSVFIGNSSFDTRGGSATQQYGYQDNGSVTNVTLADNYFLGNLVAPISASGTRYSSRQPQLEALVSATPGAIGAGLTTPPVTVTLTGATPGDAVKVGYTANLEGVIPVVWVSNTNSVSYSFYNPTGGSITVSAGNLQIMIEKPLNYAAY